MTLSNAIRWLTAFAAAALGMLLFRATVVTLCVVDGTALAPQLLQGDRVVVNRWSYGLRTGGRDGLFGYGRIGRQPIAKGDIVAMDSPLPGVSGIFLCRCAALPGDTVRVGADLMVVPGRAATCADEDYYWMEAVAGGRHIDSRQFGFVPESSIIGRACMVLFSHDDSQPPFTGYRKERALTAIGR